MTYLLSNWIVSVTRQKLNQMAEEADSSGGENSTWTKAESTFNKYVFFYF